MLAAASFLASPQAGRLPTPRCAGAASTQFAGQSKFEETTTAEGASFSRVCVASSGMLMTAKQWPASRKRRFRGVVRSRVGARARAELLDGEELEEQQAPPSKTAIVEESAKESQNFSQVFAEPAYRSLGVHLAGDLGFDPLSFSQDKKTLMAMREAEIKHSRLAMLAAVGWPLSEIVQPRLGEAIGAKIRLAEGSRAPSVMNGGLEDVSIATFLVIALEVAALLDIFEPPDRREPGDYGFDPLRLKEWAPPFASSVFPPGCQWTAEAEIYNGRVAMIAITYFAAVEFQTKGPIIDFH